MLGLSTHFASAMTKSIPFTFICLLTFARSAVRASLNEAQMSLTLACRFTFRGSAVDKAM